jgi:prepilin-type N-terminal cleavage/methylation domain-containing protein
MDRRGVTLIELIVVMVIIAIAAALTIPNIGRWIPGYRLRSAARDVVSLMRSAQMKAVSSNTQFRVSFNDVNHSYILQRKSGEVWVDDGTVQTLPPGIQIVGITLPGKNAEFNPNSTSSSGSVTLRNPKDAEKRIVLYSATGKIRVE